MKSSKLVGVWPPVMGVAVVGAMALGVSALAGPRVADQAARGTGKGGTEVTRLVTGDPTQINAVAGAGTTLVLAFNPVNPPPGIAAYPAGVTINGNELTIDRNNKDGFRAWFHAQISDWDPNGDGPTMQAYQIKIDCSGYYASDCLDLKTTPGDGLDIVPAVQTCVSNTDCRSTGPNGFGEAWVKCIAGFCENGYLDSSSATTNVPSPEGMGKGWCADDGCAGFGVATGTCNYNYFGVSDNIAGKLDAGGLYYGGTLVLDLPAGAKGKYTVNLNPDETFAAAPGSPPIDIPTLAENGFVVNYVTVSCADSDADGVCDADDLCPSTPPCVAVDAQGRPLGGLDSDCDVDLDDFHEFSACLGGPGRLPAGDCVVDADLDGDGDADLHDFQLFQQGFTGPIQP